MLLSSLVNKNLLIYVNLNNRSISISSTHLFINYFRLDLVGEHYPTSLFTNNIILARRVLILRPQI